MFFGFHLFRIRVALSLPAPFRSPPSMTVRMWTINHLLSASSGKKQNKQKCYSEPFTSEWAWFFAIHFVLCSLFAHRVSALFLWRRIHIHRSLAVSCSCSDSKCGFYKCSFLLSSSITINIIIILCAHNFSLSLSCSSFSPWSIYVCQDVGAPEQQKNSSRTHNEN